MLNKGIPAEAKKTQPYTFSDEATKKKIKRHLTDINDIITEKDIKDVKIPGAEEKDKPVPVTAGKKSKKNKKPTVDDTPGNPVTPWDVLSE